MTDTPRPLETWVPGGAARLVNGSWRCRTGGTRGFALAIAFVLFTVPFGELQNIVLGGLTIAKLMLPAIFLTLMAIRLWHVKLHPHLWAISAFLMATTPSLLSSEFYPGIALNLLGYVILFVLLRNAVCGMGDIRRVFLGYVAGLGIVSVFALVAFAFGWDLGAAMGRPLVEIWYGLPVMLGTENNPNAFATFFVPGVPIALFLCQTSRSRCMRAVYGGCLILFLLLVILTFSRSGIAGAMVGGAMAFIYGSARSARRKKAFRVAVVTTVIFGAILAASTGVIRWGDNQGGEREVSVYSNKMLSVGYRLQMTGQYLSLIAEHPLVGIGYGNLPSLMERRIGLHINSHNILFGVAIEFGLVAALFFVALILLSLRAVAKGLAAADTRAEKATGGCILAVIVGLFVHGMFHEIYVNFTLWLFIGIGGVYGTLIRNACKMRRETQR